MNKLYTISTAKEFHAITANESTIVYFYQPHCALCQRITPKLNQMALDYPDFIFIKVDGQKFPELVDLLEVNLIPTLMMFKRNQLQFIAMGEALLSHIQNSVESSN